MDYPWLMIGGLIVAGMVLLVLEVYVPGFVLGSIGVVLLAGAAWWTYEKVGIRAASAVALIEAVLGVVVVAAALKYFPETPVGKKMVLAQDETGVRAQTARGRELIGREGVAQSLLRPAGVALVDGKRLDVIAESGMIESGSRICVVAVDENRIVVRKLTT